MITLWLGSITILWTIWTTLQRELVQQFCRVVKQLHRVNLFIRNRLKFFYCLQFCLLWVYKNNSNSPLFSKTVTNFKIYYGNPCKLWLFWIYVKCLELIHFTLFYISSHSGNVRNQCTTKYLLKIHRTLYTMRLTAYRLQWELHFVFTKS